MKHAHPKWVHWLTGVVVVAIVVLLVVVLTASKANPPDEFVTFVDRGASEELKNEQLLQIELLEASVANSEEPDIEILLQLGNAYHRFGELGKAKVTYEQIIELNPNDVAARENLASTLIEMGDLVNAQRNLAEAFSLGGDLRNVYRIVELINEHFPEDKSRIEDIAKVAISRYGRRPRLIQIMADAYLDLGEYQKALDHYNVAADLNPNEDYAEEIAEARRLLIEEQKAQ